MTRIVVATGTKREAATLDGLGLIVVPGGGDETALAQLLEAESIGAAGVVSFGMAGGLIDGLAIGEWVIGDRVIGPEERGCDRDWTQAIAQALPHARIGAVYADGGMASATSAKRARSATGAIAVDMESHVVARIAAARGLPFAVVRCISDTVDRDLPPAVAVAMRPDGRVAVGAVLRSLLAHPRQIGAVAGTGLGFARAMRALERGAPTVGPALASLG